MDIGDMVGLALAGTVGAVAGQSGKIKDSLGRLKAKFNSKDDGIREIAALRKLFPEDKASDLVKLLKEIKQTQAETMTE